MAPMKYEEQLKDKLEQRTIQPSTDAWQKLNDKLDANKSKKNNKGFWYLGIAASIVGIMLITNVFDNDNTNIVEPTIVDIDKTNSEPNNDNVKEENTIEEKEILSNETEVLASENVKKETQKQEQTSRSSLKQKIKKEQLKLIPNKTEEMVVAINDNEVNKEENKEAVVKKLSFEEQKAKDVVAQIQSMQKIKEVTDAEIDALLGAAQREITFKRLYNENTKSIDANALLLSIEDEIEEQSFRTRVFEMLKAGYSEVRTVVADRNN